MRRLVPGDGRIWLFPLITVAVLASVGLYQHSQGSADGHAARAIEQTKLEKAQ